METSFLQVSSNPPLPSEPPTSHVNLEETAKKERQRIEQRLKDKGIRYGSYPRFTVAVKGQKVVSFHLFFPLGCYSLFRGLERVGHGDGPNEQFIHSGDLVLYYILYIK